MFLLTAPSGQDLFEIHLHSAAEKDDLFIYTKSTNYKLDPMLWQALQNHIQGSAITVTVRGVSSGGGTPSLGTSGDFTIAPAQADGAMIYWTTAGFDNNATNTNLQGFHVGDEGVTTALTTDQVQQVVPRANDLTNMCSTSCGMSPCLNAPKQSKVYCIGCHTSTPDGNYVGFTAQWPWANAFASVAAADAGTGLAVGAQPPWLTEGAIQNMSPNFGKDPYSPWYNPPAVNQVMLGVQTLSRAHYMTGDRIVVAQLGAAWNTICLASSSNTGSATGVISQLAWFDLEWNPAGGTDGGLMNNPGLPTAPCTGSGINPAGVSPAQPCVSNPTSSGWGGWGIIQRMGDETRSAGAPNWMHNGNTIAYVSTDNGTKDGRIGCEFLNSCTADVYTVPYSKTGGPASGLAGASDPAYNEYYPAYSPDDQFVAFNRVPVNHSMYNTPEAEVYVVPSGGGTATRLLGNDPAQCTNVKSPGAQNTWPKWAPTAVKSNVDGKIYYWVIFSSSRSPLASGKEQLYVSAVVVDPNTNQVSTYPAIYLWNQSPMVNNLIPAWDNFTISHGGMNN
jgi:hypothetical protein